MFDFFYYVRLGKAKSFINSYFWYKSNNFNTMSILKQIGQYLYLVKKDPNQQNTQWMSYMHGINKISIFLFLFAMIVIVVRLIMK